MLHRVGGRGRGRGGGAALGRGGARAPAAPALATLSGPRPPSRFGPVARPRPVRPRCPFRRLKPVGQAAGGKFARLRQRRLCEGRGRGCCPEWDVGATCLESFTGLGPHLPAGQVSWRRVWEDVRAGGPTPRSPWGLGDESARTPAVCNSLGLGKEGHEGGMQAGGVPDVCRGI